LIKEVSNPMLVWQAIRVGVIHQSFRFLAIVSPRPILDCRASPYRPVSQIQILRTGRLQSSRWRPHPIGQKETTRNFTAMASISFEAAVQRLRSAPRANPRDLKTPSRFVARVRWNGRLDKKYVIDVTALDLRPRYIESSLD
jgi:hypothetical protein